MNIERRVRLVGEVIFMAIVIAVVAAIVGTYNTVKDNVRLRRENEKLVNTNGKLQVQNWTLETAASFCPPPAESVHIVEE